MTASNGGLHPDLLTSSYHYDLPSELIAQRPQQQRDQCRLLGFDAATGEYRDGLFHQINDFLPPESTIVFNHSKVVPSRIFGSKLTGAQVEVLVLEPQADPEKVPCFLRTNGKKRIGDKLQFMGGLEAEVVGRDEQVFFLRFATENLVQALEEIGKIPIPPYIRDGLSDEQDRLDYQTIYAQKKGSIAAPTAGLHFTTELLEFLQQQGHQIANVCLHVGAGTFAPVKTDAIADHKMHTENFEIEQADYTKINQAKKVIAVGTTSLRVLESIYGKKPSFDSNGIHRSSTNIFLHPGIEVKSIDGIITNFHLPESTLLMLISSLIGREKTLEIYRHAIQKQYQFYSYGDAMFIKRERHD